MGAFDHAAAGGYGSTRPAAGAEKVEPDGRADDVGNAVQRPDLVKVNLFERQAVRPRLGLRQPAKDAQSQLALPRREPAAVKDLLDVG